MKVHWLELRMLTAEDKIGDDPRLWLRSHLYVSVVGGPRPFVFSHPSPS